MINKIFNIWMLSPLLCIKLDYYTMYILSKQNLLDARKLTAISAADKKLELRAAVARCQVAWNFVTASWHPNTWASQLWWDLYHGRKKVRVAGRLVVGSTTCCVSCSATSRCHTGAGGSRLPHLLRLWWFAWSFPSVFSKPVSVFSVWFDSRIWAPFGVGKP